MADGFSLELGTVCHVLLPTKDLPLKVTAGISDGDSCEQGTGMLSESI